MTPRMLMTEINFLQSHLKKTDNFLEWGSGGSTVYFSQFVKRFYSVEHNFFWYRNVSKALDLSDRNNTELVWVPESERFTGFEAFRNYIAYPIRFGVSTFNHILIDGRCRVFCSDIALYLSDWRTNIFIHDFSRDRYQEILMYYERIDQHGELALLRKRDVTAVRQSGRAYALAKGLF